MRHSEVMKILLLGAAAAALAAFAVAQAPDPWKLVWSDEFDKDGRPDPAKWTYETGFVRNRELQWYQPENAWCEKGLLIIEGRREAKINPKAEYTSASLTTKGIV